MVFCKNKDCNSILVKVSDLNFALVKPEGEPAAKAGLTKKEFYCQSCGEIWMFDPKVESLYFEYRDLKNKTMMVAQDVDATKRIEVPYISVNDLMRRTEIAKDLVTNYKHMLDLEPGDWYDLEQEALI